MRERAARSSSVAAGARQALRCRFRSPSAARSCSSGASSALMSLWPVSLIVRALDDVPVWAVQRAAGLFLKNLQKTRWNPERAPTAPQIRTEAKLIMLDVTVSLASSRSAPKVGKPPSRAMTMRERAARSSSVAAGARQVSTSSAGSRTASRMATGMATSSSAPSLPRWSTSGPRWATGQAHRELGILAVGAEGREAAEQGHDDAGEGRPVLITCRRRAGTRSGHRPRLRSEPRPS
jgi:hypothetical protein